MKPKRILEISRLFTFYCNDSRYDELPWVRQMINTYNNPLNEVLLLSTEVEELSYSISKTQDEPFGGIPTLAYSKIFEKARQKDIIVLLDGQGIDEQLAGYDYYRTGGESTIQGAKESPFRPQLLTAELRDQWSLKEYPKPFQEDILNIQYRDLFYTKIPRALRFNDRISMFHSTELREPFLDYRLVEYAFSLPESFKYDGVQTKKILRDTVSSFVPKTIAYAPKRPLQTPQREWLGNELSDFVELHMAQIRNGRFRHWFDIDNMQNEWNNYRNGNQSSSFHIWQLINFSLLIN